MVTWSFAFGNGKRNLFKVLVPFDVLCESYQLKCRMLAFAAGRESLSKYTGHFMDFSVSWIMYHSVNPRPGHFFSVLVLERRGGKGYP
jgi:hypothetical protein